MPTSPTMSHFDLRSERIVHEFIRTMARCGHSKAKIAKWVAIELATYYLDDGDGVARSTDGDENERGRAWL